MMEGLRVSGLGPGRFSNGTVEIRVGRVQAAYVGSARLGDHVEAVVRRWTLERCSLVVHCVVQCAGRVLVRGRLTVAFIESATGALTETPDEVRAALVGLTP
jgi:acyl-CoA thioesterase FadM